MRTRWAYLIVTSTVSVLALGRTNLQLVIRSFEVQTEGDPRRFLRAYGSGQYTVTIIIKIIIIRILNGFDYLPNGLFFK